MLLPPFDRGQPFFRGNLHGHSTHSDGEFDPVEVVGIYRSRGYDFTCLSDHLWKDERFCAQSVLDSGTLALDGDGFITIPSAEIHCFGKRYTRDGLWHILANGLPADFAMAGEDETAPELVDRALEAGAFVSIPHPEWYALSDAETMSVAKAHAVEVYNHAAVLESGRGMGLAAADHLLNEGRRVSLVATDDSHGRIDDAGGGWVMVAADRLDADSIIEALKAGRHYSSTGPELRSLEWDNGSLTVESSPAAQINVAGSGAFSQGRFGDGITRAVFELGEVESGFFRVTVTDSAGLRAWSNPIHKDALDDRDG